MKLSAHVKLTIQGPSGGFFGPGVAELLELLEETGSVKLACLRMGLGYTKGRRIIKRAETELGISLISIQHGGTGGGASVLTEEGRRFLCRYRELEAKTAAFAAEKFKDDLRDLCYDNDSQTNVDCHDRGHNFESIFEEDTSARQPGS